MICHGNLEGGVCLIIGAIKKDGVREKYLTGFWGFGCLLGSACTASTAQFTCIIFKQSKKGAKIYHMTHHRLSTGVNNRDTTA